MLRSCVSVILSLGLAAGAARAAPPAAAGPRAGSRDALWAAVRAGDVKAPDAALFASPADGRAVRAALEKAGAAPLKPAAPQDRDAWAPLAGTYESDNG